MQGYYRTMDIYKVIGKNIEKHRLDANISKMQLSRDMNVHRNTINYWENGINHITIKNLIKLSKLFKVNINKLIS